MMRNSRALLVDYAQNGSESAFRELVDRYVDLVYSTALRLVSGDRPLAEDITQSVLLDLARQAERLPAQVMLGGWLHQHTRFVASHALRGERRRRIREQQTAELTALEDESNVDFGQLKPVLDEAIGELEEEDRTAILLRFFEQFNFRAVGQALGSNEDAARMRVNRALGKLQQLLKNKGVARVASALEPGLAAHAVGPAPAGLADSVVTAVFAGVPSVAPSLFKIMTLSKPKVVLAVAAVLAGLATPLLLQHQSLVRLREENRSLAARAEELRRQNERLASPKADAAELAQALKDQGELLRLRGEVNLLRRDLAAAKAKKAQVVQNPSEKGSTTNLAMAFSKLRADVDADLGDGQTLLTGGWTIGQGKHQFLLMTPRVTGASRDQVFIQAYFVDVPDAVLAELGLEAFKADGEQSSVKEVFSPEKTQQLLEKLKATDGVDFVSAPRISSSPGREARISVTKQITVAGETQQLGPSVQVLPAVSADGNTVSMRVGAEVGVLTRRAE